MTGRLDPSVRTDQLLAVALRQAAAEGWRCITHDSIARDAGVSRALVVHRLGTMEQVRRSVMRAAVKERVVRVVAEGLAAQDRHACKADATLRALAGEWVRGAR